MAQRIPHLVDGVLHVPESPGGPKIAVGSPSWIEWLADPATRSFSFRGSSVTYTARKERRSRGGEYWTAYRRQGGRLRKAYLGKAENLTLDRLDNAAALLASSDDIPVDPIPDTTAQDTRSPRADATATVGTTTNDLARKRTRPGTSGDPLLLTKLSVPPARRSLVARPHLTERLRGGLSGKLTLVCAPAGFGKSTLLSAALAAPFSNERSAAWLSLDPDDNDPARFWRYFITAIDQLQADSGESSLALLGSPQAPPIETVLTNLINELAVLPAVSVLVLDDYHAIESRAIHTALAFFIDHLPPRMHLAIATRADPPVPLARLRARGELSEVRADDLRFTSEEAGTFLKQVMGLHIPPEHIAELEERTEGWVAGLQLAALAMRDHADLSGFIASFTGSNRHVVDYLAEEVLGQQREEVRDFLLQTSILDRMCGPLCNAVTGHPDEQATLERLERANLFLVPLDDERRWYRYHHLFADVLRQHLNQECPNLPPELHRKASSWFEGEELIPEAIHHSLAAQDWERAIRLIETSGMAVVLSRQVQMVTGWIDEIPEALVRECPVLCTIHALALLFSNRPDAAEARLGEAERSLRANPTTDEARAILGRAAVIRAAIARFTGDLERCVTMGRRALQLLPETEATARERAAASTNAALVYQVSGDVTPANERPLEEAIVTFQASGDLIPLLRSYNFLARLQTLQGRLRTANATYEEATGVVSGRDRLWHAVNSAAYYVGLGDIHREWNHLDSAESHLRRGIDLLSGSLTVDADTVAHGYLSLARLQQARGRHADARATLEEFANLARQRGFVPLLLARGEAAQARLALMQDDLPSAVSWAEASGLDADDEPSYLREEEYLTLARVLIAQVRNEAIGTYLDDALGLLDRLCEAAEGEGRMSSVIEILTLRALALQAHHQSSEALAALERALARAEPEGYVRLFVDEGAPMAELLSGFLKARSRGPRDSQQHPLHSYVRGLLAAFTSLHTSTELPVESASEGNQALLDPLTAREREVLELIAEGLSNQEIAARLFIEIGTVKGYVHSILRKFEVDSRTKAISRAHELRLLSE